MPITSVIPKNFNQLVISILKPFPETSKINEFVNLSYKIALSYLRTKYSYGAHIQERYGISVEDMAYDSIAELFSRDDNGNFNELKRYFNKLGNLSAILDDELFANLRRLVCSAVNVRFFKSYGEQNPILSKILRNVKNTLKQHPSVKLIVYQEENFIVSTECNDLLKDFPLIPNELLSADFYPRINSKTSLREMLTIVGDIINCQTGYRKMVNLLDVATLICQAYLTDAFWKMDSADISPDQKLLLDDLKLIAKQTVIDLKNQHSSKYIDKEKLTRDELNSIFSAVEDILLLQFGMDGNEIESYYIVLSKHLTTLDKQIYATKYRTILEYFAKTAKKEMSNVLKNEVMEYS
jgi:hypothetical protein